MKKIVIWKSNLRKNPQIWPRSEKLTLVHCDDEDIKSTNWQELIQWIEELEERNPKAWEDGFVQGMYAFSG